MRAYQPHTHSVHTFHTHRHTHTHKRKARGDSLTERVQIDRRRIARVFLLVSYFDLYSVGVEPWPERRVWGLGVEGIAGESLEWNARKIDSVWEARLVGADPFEMETKLEIEKPSRPGRIWNGITSRQTQHTHTHRQIRLHSHTPWRF